MSQKSDSLKPSSERLVRDIRRATPWPCQRRQIGGKLHPNLGLSGDSRIKIRCYDFEKPERPGG